MGVYAFLVGVAFFFAAVFLGAAFLTAGALVLVTRPDLVLPVMTVCLSSTAGAWKKLDHMLT